MRKAWRWLFFIFLVFFLAGLRPEHAAAVPPLSPARQGTTLAMVAPSACPSAGCAPGQRMNLRFDFGLSIYTPSADPNVKICFYAPDSWALTSDAPDPVTGDLTGSPYTLTPSCAEDTLPPSGYSLISARVAAIQQTTFSDSIPLVFRFGAAGTGRGQVVARLFEKAGAAEFTRTQQSTTVTLSMATIATIVYVANDPAACGSNSPCFVNSADDGENGVGTGLRDAVDTSAAGSSLFILGNYTIKSNTVVINKQLALSGINDASITYAPSGACTEPMLSLQENVALRNLNINDGSCSGPGRGLVEVNTDKAVTIESNDLVNGDNAIVLLDNSGAVTVRYNQITGNTGYAVFASNNSAGGALEVSANNLNGNRAGGAVDCSASASGAIANRKANHNYWGGAAPGSDTSHCTIASGKRLGAPIVQKSGAPGVDAQLVNVTTDKIYAFDNQIAYRRIGGSDFPLFVVNHGYMTEGGAPFTTAAGGESPSPCSNYWDVFLPDGISPAGTLELSFKYNKTQACQAAINSNKYCDQTSIQANYPLYWFDPATNVTRWWDTTGQRPENLSSGDGQATTCNITANEVQVALDESGRPNLTGDLNYTPFMVGVPVLRSFLPLASSQNITVTWTTNNEPDVNGFYVLRSYDGTNFSPISDLISHRGTALTGVTNPPYSFVDTGRVNGVTYHYRLQVVRTDGTSFYSAIFSLAANVATITPTFTASPTFTQTVPRPTNTLRPTLIPTKRPTSRPLATVTPRPVATTITPYVFVTAGESGTGYPTNPLDETSAALLATQGGSSSPPDGTKTAGAALSGTAIAMVGTSTPQPTPTETIFPLVSAQETGKPGPWVSLILGLLAGLAITGSIGGWWYYRAKG